ncbi:unnamed protein product [Porites lobata]|uniref:Uncharacterized protein n=1 Tax=Porites lobata TaxID=104759 RepID=A0ABN8P0B9_9CNID|nr:unnamed protein product [Porites lobata]
MKRQSTPCLLSDAFNIWDGNSAVTSSAANRYVEALSHIVSLEMVLIDLLVIYAVNLEGAVRVTEVTQSEEACTIPVLFNKTDV